MHNYPLFMNMMSCVIYIPLSFAYIIPAMLFTDNISQEQRDIPKYKFAGKVALLNCQNCLYVCSYGVT